MNKVDILVLGSLTIDEVDGKLQIGGPGFYTYFASLVMGVNVFIIGTMGENLPWDLHKFIPGIFVVYEKTISFRHTYNHKTQERVSYLLQPPQYTVNLFLEQIIEELQPKAIIVNPVYHEFSVSMLKHFINKDFLLAIDVQGLLRRIDHNNKIYLDNLPSQYEEILENADIVKATLDEKVFLKKTYGKTFVITKGRKGSEVLDGEKVRISAPIIPISGDPTGAGDVFLLGFVARYIETEDPSESLVWGQALASMVVDQDIAPRVPKGNFKDEIEDIMRRRQKLRDILQKRVKSLRELVKIF